MKKIGKKVRTVNRMSKNRISYVNGMEKFKCKFERKTIDCNAHLPTLDYTPFYPQMEFNSLFTFAAMQISDVNIFFGITCRNVFASGFSAITSSSSTFSVDSIKKIWIGCHFPSFETMRVHLLNSYTNCQHMADIS